MKKNLHLKRIVFIQHVGFLAIIVVCFLNELLKLPTLIFSDHPFSFVFQRSTLDMLLVLTVWFLVGRATGRAMERIRYLEKFLRVCSWCRRIECHGEWMRWEEYVRKGLETPTTHGICPECMVKEQEAIERLEPAQQK